MNVIDLFNTVYERALNEGAVDDLEARYIHGLNTKMLDLMARTKESRYKNDPKALAGLRREYDKIKSERDSFYKIRETKKGQDVVDRAAKMKTLTPAKPGVAGAVKDVASGLKNFLQGKPETGPTYESQKKNSEKVEEYLSMGSDKNYQEAKPYKNYKIYVRRKPFGNTGMYTAHTEIDRKEFMGKGPSQEEAIAAVRDRIDFVLNAQRKVTGSSTIDFNVKFATDLLADPRQTFYAKLEKINGEPKLIIAGADIASDPELLAAGDFKRSAVRNQVDDEGRATPLPGIPLTAKGLRSGDWIANGRYTIGKETQDRDGNRVFDLTYHSTAHTKSDKLRLNQPAFTLGTAREVDEHGGGIGPKQRWQDLMPEQNNPEDYDDADEFGMPGSEFFSDEDDRLRDGDYVRDRQDGEYGEIFRMSGDPSERRVRILDRDGRGWYISPERLVAVDRTDPDIMKYFGKRRQRDMDEGWSDAVVARRTGRPRTPYSVYIKGKKWKDFANDDHAEAVANKLKAKFKADGRDPETITIAPTDITEEALIEGIRDTASATAVVACLLTGGSLSGCATAPQQTTSQQVLKTGQDVGRTIQTAKKITRAGTEEEVRQEIRNLARGIGNPAELNNSNILRIWKRIKGAPPAQPEPEAPEYGPAPPRQRAPQYEGKEIANKQDYHRAIDSLDRQIQAESNPVNKQILRKQREILQKRAQAEGWIKSTVQETNQSQPAEQAILKRIFVAHKDLLVKYGPEKVTQAAEEVAYNVGDQEIGSSDVSGWVNQVMYILGAKPESPLNEKWSEKYKKSINCANPKGFSQRAHCQGRKKK